MGWGCQVTPSLERPENLTAASAAVGRPMNIKKKCNQWLKQHFSYWINNLNGIRRELDYKTPALKLGAAAMAMIMITSTWYSQRWSCYNNCCRLSYCYCHHQNKLGLNYTSFDEDGSLIEWWRTISSDIDIVAQFQANVSFAWHHNNWAVPVPSLATPSKYKNLGESWRIFKHPRTFRGNPSRFSPVENVLGRFRLDRLVLIFTMQTIGGIQSRSTHLWCAIWDSLVLW